MLGKRRRASFLLLCLICLSSVLLQANHPTLGGVAKEGTAFEKEYDSRVKVFAPNNITSNNVAICLVIYNESLYLDEWVDFHVALGFSPIYIYDNSLEFQLNNTPYSGNNHSWYQTRQDVRDYIRLIHFPVSPVQIPAYERCIRQDAKDSSFVALFDIDEFLVLKTHDNVVDFMEHHCDFRCGQLSINWQNMGTSHEKQYTPIPVTKRNVHFDKSRAMHATIKVIVRPRHVAQPMRWRHSVMLKKGKRWVDTNYKLHSYPVSDYRRQHNYDQPLDVAVLYHYPFRSEGEFRYKTCGKGTSLHPRGETPMCNNPKYYTIYNGTEFDDTAWRQLTRMVPKYRMYGVATNITL